MQSSDMDETTVEPYLETAPRFAGSWNSTENTWIMNLLPLHEPVLIKPLVSDSVLPGDWFLVLGVSASIAVLVWLVIEVARINENSIFEPLLDDSAEAKLKFLFNLVWLAWPCEWGFSIAAASCTWSHHCTGWHQVGYSFASPASCHSCCPLCFLVRRRTSAAQVRQAP